MGTDLNFEVTFHSFLPMIVRFCTVQTLQLCTTKLRTKFFSLDFTTTDCSILQIVVLLRRHRLQFKVPMSNNSMYECTATSTTNHSKFCNTFVVLLSKYNYLKKFIENRISFLIENIGAYSYRHMKPPFGLFMK